jgi:MFS transporter, DHA2 family, glioxin efflux transporter
MDTDCRRPLLLGTVVATILSGILITTFGHFVPMMILGGVGATIASGLIYTLNTNSSSGQWIGFQVLAGLAVGVALQVPVISAQGTSEPSDLSAATAMILCKTNAPLATTSRNH